MNSMTNIQSINKNYDSFNISRIKKTKPLYSIIGLKKKQNFLKSLLSEQEDCLDLPSRNKNNTYNINKFKSVLIQNDLIKLKTRNLTMKNLFKCNSENDIMIKTKNDKKINITNNNNFLLLTSLYKLPSIKKQNKITFKPQSPLRTIIHTKCVFPKSTSSINTKKTFNDSITSSCGESFNNYFNFRYNSEINKSSSELNQSSQSNNKSKVKKKIYSNLFASLKDKYYSDVEKKYNHKLDVRLFPSDHSMKDKIIYMKKVGIFWDSVLKYCVPIINGRKYKLQHMLAEQNKIKDFNSNQNNSNYYDIFVKENNSGVKFSKSKSLSKIL